MALLIKLSLHPHTPIDPFNQVAAPWTGFSTGYSNLNVDISLDHPESCVVATNIISAWVSKAISMRFYRLCFYQIILKM